MIPENLSGQVLGNYKLLELLGVGGMGAVYRAYQVSLKREVAIKVLPRSLAMEPGYAERFNREAETAAALEHPHIVPIVDYGNLDGISFIVMRLLSGGTLAERFAARRNQLPSLGEIAELLRQLASALDYAHNRGVIHRDLKLTNVMFDAQGNAYLVDFGIAKLIGEAGLTTTGMTVGTPSYMAPEQWRGEDLTGAADIYALGVMTYQLVTGRVPFEAPTPFALMHKHLYEEVTPVQALRADIPEGLTGVLQRAMAKEARDRFETATAYAQAFAEVVAGEQGATTQFMTFELLRSPVPLSAKPTSSTTAATVVESTRPATTVAIVRRNPQIAVFAVVLVLMIAVGAFLLGRQNPSASEQAAALATATAPALATQTGEEPASGSATPQPATPTLILLTDTPAATEEMPPTLTPVLVLVSPEPTATQQSTATAIPEPTVLYPSGRRIQFFWNDVSFYWHNASSGSIRVSPLDFEALDAFGNPVGSFFDGRRWTIGFNTVEAGRCVAIELLQTSGRLRPEQCRGYNSLLTLQQNSAEIFWVARNGASQFRVFWEGQEVGRCQLNTRFCELRIP